jgi:hypothetical protein
MLGDLAELREGGARSAEPVKLRAGRYFSCIVPSSRPFNLKTEVGHGTTRKGTEKSSKPGSPRATVRVT